MALILSRHARERMAEMRLTLRDVGDAINHPEVVTRTHRDGDPHPTIRYTAGAIAVVVSARNGVVITVLPRRYGTYSRDDDRGGHR